MAYASTSWDIEKYRTKFESDEHWDLKKAFIEAHKGTFPEDKVICLAQVFVNIELLRCRYPVAVMKQVDILAKKIGHDFKAKRKKLLQRTFVKASDAARDKVKGLKPNYSEAKPSTPTNDRTSSPQTRDGNPSFQTQLPNKYHLALEQNKTIASSNSKSIYGNASPNSSSSSSFTRSTNSTTMYEDVILSVNTYIRFPGFYPALVSSMGFSRLTLDEVVSHDSESEGRKMTTSTLNFKRKNGIVLLGSGTGYTLKDARNSAAEESFQMLLENCYTIKYLKRSASDAEISFDTINCKNPNNVGNTGDGRISNDSVGAKMLKLMGWSGGGLGKDGMGIVEPIQESTIIGRSGLGLQNETNVTPKFCSAVKQLINDFKRRRELSDLVFSPDLSEEHRKYIHSIVNRFGKKILKSASYGKGANRFLVVSSKFHPHELMHRVLSDGGKTDKYEVCLPGTFTSETLKDEYKGLS